VRPTEKQRVEHILDSIEKIKKYTENLSEKDFLDNDLVKDAVLYLFSVIGEAVIFIDGEMLKKYPYPWHLVRSFRNYIAHEYFGLNMKLVYQSIKQDLPVLHSMIKEIIKNEL
jgi:uncharacterized protein with HEPN domain